MRAFGRRDMQTGNRVTLHQRNLEISDGVVRYLACVLDAHHVGDDSSRSPSCTEWIANCRKKKHIFGDKQIVVSEYDVFRRKNYAFWNAPFVHRMHCEL